MAATRLIALHVNKGKTVAQCLSERLDYSQNPIKTEQGELITSYACEPETAAMEAEYEQYRPLRDQKKDFLKAKQNADLILRRQQEERDERPREK